MEATAKNSLEQNIKAWRKSFQSKSEITEDNLKELEAHLLDEIDALTEKGLSEEEAFLVAKYRIGDKEELSKEFKKVNKFNYWLDKLTPYLIGAIVFTLVSKFYSSISILSYFLVHSIELYVPIIVPSLIIYSSLILALFYGFKYYKKVKLKLKIWTWALILLAIPVFNLLILVLSTKVLQPQDYAEISKTNAILTWIGYASTVILGFFLLLAKYKKRKLQENQFHQID